MSGTFASGLDSLTDDDGSFWASIYERGGWMQMVAGSIITLFADILWKGVFPMSAALFLDARGGGSAAMCIPGHPRGQRA